MENHTESMKPALKRAYPVMLQRMSKPGGGRGRTRAQSPQPSVSSPAGHGSGGTSPSAKKRFVGSPAPLLADPLPRAQPPVITPDHEAFASIHLGFKTAEMKLSLYYNDVVLRFSASPSAEGLELKRGEFDKLIEAIEAIDHHMSSQDTTGNDVRLWVLLKSRKNNSMAYLTVKPFRGVMYVDIRDYWYPNGPDGGLARTTRGVTLPKAGWKTIKRRLSDVEERWRDAEMYLARNNTTESQEDSQLVILDWYVWN